MNKVDLLLKINKEKLVKPTKEVEIKRLSELVGEPFTITCQALTAEEFGEMQEDINVDEDGKINIDKDLQAKYIVKGIKDPNFSNQQVVEYFGAINSVDAIKKVFLPGEITKIYNVINDLSGFGKGAVEEIKN